MKIESSNTFFISGQHGVGKTFLCSELSKRCPRILHLECGRTIRAIHEKSDNSKSLHDWITDNEKIFGNHFAESIAYIEFKKLIDNNPNADILFITGCRAKKQIDYLSRKFKIEYPHIIFIESDIYLQKKNYEHRENKILTYNEFIRLIQYDNLLGLDDLRLYVQQNPPQCLSIINDSNDLHKLLSRVVTFINSSISPLIKEF